MTQTSDVGPIVHPTDFSEGARAALPYALYLAALLETELRLVHVASPDESGPRNPSFPSPTDARRRAGRWLAAADGSAGASEGALDGVEVRRETIRGEAPEEAILDHLGGDGRAVTVMGTQGRRGVRRLVLGSVAERVVRGAAGPVMTVRQEIEGWGERGLRGITVAVDLSPMMPGALAWATELAAAVGAELEVLHVVRSPAAAADPGRAREIYAAVGEIDAPEVSFRVQVVAGRPERRICQVSEEPATDLVVTATHGRSGPSRFVLGSVAEAVIRRADAPVVTVARPPRDG